MERRQGKVLQRACIAAKYSGQKIIKIGADEIGLAPVGMAQLGSVLGKQAGKRRNIIRQACPVGLVERPDFGQGHAEKESPGPWPQRGIKGGKRGSAPDQTRRGARSLYLALNFFFFCMQKTGLFQRLAYFAAMPSVLSTSLSTSASRSSAFTVPTSRASK